MRTAQILLLTVFSSLDVLGQSTPTINSDSSVKTSEFYSWTYYKQTNEYGHPETYWFLNSDFKLYFGRTSHHPPANIRKLVGSWKIQKDSITLVITKPDKLGLSEPTSFKYRVFQIYWSTNTGLSEKGTGEPLILKSVGIILSDNPQFSLTETKEKITKYIRDNHKLTELNKEEESIRDWLHHEQVDALVRQYFNSEEVTIGIKQYRNKTLWIR